MKLLKVSLITFLALWSLILLYSLPVDGKGKRNLQQLQTARVAYSRGWNLVSFPVMAPCAAKDSLFPGSISTLYGYTERRYSTSDTVANGCGYWLKFGGPDTVILTTPARLPVHSIPLKVGWNMIGSTTTAVPIESVKTIFSPLAWEIPQQRSGSWLSTRIRLP